MQAVLFAQCSIEMSCIWHIQCGCLPRSAKDGIADVKTFSGHVVLTFPLGRGDVCDALDLGAATMSVGEEASRMSRR